MTPRDPLAGPVVRDVALELDGPRGAGGSQRARLLWSTPQGWRYWTLVLVAPDGALRAIVPVVWRRREPAQQPLREYRLDLEAGQNSLEFLAACAVCREEHLVGKARELEIAEAAVRLAASRRLSAQRQAAPDLVKALRALLETFDPDRSRTETACVAGWRILDLVK